ncbi:MAG: 5-formyltetrahydrofolate cyclo-ligase, partial [Nocardioides sp.]|nr:5-formyltetrahydrofolate cyclo-ligase [Nocardioides sp.]
GTADVVQTPALAVSPSGVRLGRGGGCYDRALGRVPVGTFTCVLLYDGEVGLDVPVEPHDRPVLFAATPSGVVRLG